MRQLLFPFFLLVTVCAAGIPTGPDQVTANNQSGKGKPGNPVLPGVYNKLSRFQPWVKDKMAAN